MTRQAMDSAEHNDARETAAVYQAEEALREVESGNREQARAAANAAVQAGAQPGRAGDGVSGAGPRRRYGRGGEAGRGPRQDISIRYPGPAVLAANHPRGGCPGAQAIELGDARNLLPIYLRGQAYLTLDDGNRAAVEFQKFIDHRGLVGNFPWGALAQLQLARAYVLSRDKTKAKTAYQDFLTLWKNADPDIPILKEAKADYAKLQ
jgi:hypothetical protein